ncbi:MAG: c-type cytochrome [Nitrospinales bacterium]
MRNSEISIRKLLVLFICLIFLASCGDSSKETKADKSKNTVKAETSKEATPTEDDSKDDMEETAGPDSSESDMKDDSEATEEKEAESATEDSPEPEKVAESATEPEAETKAEPEVVASPAPEPTPEPAPVEVAKAEPKPEPVPKPKPVVVPEAKPEPVVEPTPAPVVEPAPEPVVEPAPAPKVAKTSGQCPQPRKTKSAPSNIAKMDKTGGANADNGKKLYTKTAKPMACKMCHGDLGDGAGKLGAMLKPPPRNFTCDKTMKSVTAGQMFWIIKNGSKGTGMVAHKALKDAEIWDVVKFIRADFVN